MNKVLSALAAALLSGCFAAGHVAETGDGGLKTKCGAACAEYKTDGSGCAKFQQGTSETCTAYIDKICKIEPSQCKK